MKWQNPGKTQPLEDSGNDLFPKPETRTLGLTDDSSRQLDERMFDGGSPGECSVGRWSNSPQSKGTEPYRRRPHRGCQQGPQHVAAQPVPCAVQGSVNCVTGPCRRHRVARFAWMAMPRAPLEVVSAQQGTEAQLGIPLVGTLFSIDKTGRGRLLFFS